MFVVGETFAGTAVAWLSESFQNAHKKCENMIAIGSDKKGVTRLKAQLPDAHIVHSSELLGKVEHNVSSVVLLDDAVDVPVTISNSKRNVRVTRLKVDFCVP